MEKSLKKRSQMKKVFLCSVVILCALLIACPDTDKANQAPTSSQDPAPRQDPEDIINACPSSEWPNKEPITVTWSFKHRCNEGGKMIIQFYSDFVCKDKFLEATPPRELYLDEMHNLQFPCIPDRTVCWGAWNSHEWWGCGQGCKKECKDCCVECAIIDTQEPVILPCKEK